MFLLILSTQIRLFKPELIQSVLGGFGHAADERSVSHFEQGFELVVGEVGVVDDPFRDEWSLDDMHRQLDVGCGR